MAYKSLLIAQLKRTFPDVKVYDEVIQQGLETPCFVIKQPQQSRNKGIGNQVVRNVFMFAVYHPETDDKRTELDSVADKILESEAWKYLGNKHHIHHLTAEHNDLLLALSFSLKVYGTYKTERADPMTRIEGGVNFD